MSSKYPRKLILPLLFFALAMVFALAMLAGRKGDPHLKEAEENYHAGEMAQTIASRKEAFNKSLALFLEMEQKYQPAFGSGKLYYDIGNTYFQLAEYPWAILYYLRAKELMPRDAKVERNLAVAREKLSLPAENAKSPFANVLFFHYYLSLPERLQLFLLLSLATLFFCSLHLWTNRRWIKFCIVISLIPLTVMLLSLGYTRYISPVQGVLVNASDLYRDAGTEYAKVGERPLSGGTVVEVLDVRPDGKWLKVQSASGELGYAPQEAVRIIQGIGS